MNIESVLQNAALRHEEFPVTTQKVFLAHAAVSPLPRRVCAAIQEYVQQAACLGQFGYIHAEIEKRTRRNAAALLGADEDEIAFVSSTSMGLSLVAAGLPWQEGDNVVVADGDFPSNIYPWLNLRERGVRTKFIPRHNDGAVTLDDVENVIDDSTRLVSLSSVNFVTGFRIDIASIGEYLSKRGILFCVDAIQSLGAVPTGVKYVDFLATNAHKWLLGPLGIGILFVKREHFERLRPCLAGWKSVKSSEQYLSYDLDFLDSAKRYEPGGGNIVGLCGLHTALELLLEIGIDNITSRLQQIRRTLVSSLDEKGYDVSGPTKEEQTSGITSFTSKRQDIVEVRRNLDSRGFIVSLRDSLDSGKCIRVSPHFYNTDDEILQLLAELPDCG